MRILHLIHRFPPAIGGGESWCNGVVSYLAARGYEVEVLTFRATEEGDLWGAATVPERHVAVGAVDLHPRIRIRRCALSDTPWGLFRLMERVGLHLSSPYSAELFGRTLAAARHADVIHINLCNALLSFWGLAVARLTGRPAVITPHFHPSDPTCQQPAVFWLLRTCDAIVAVTPYERELFTRRGVAADRIVVATNAVDARGFDEVDTATRLRVRERVRARWGLPPETPVVAYLGRKTPQKAIPVLLEAAALVARARNLALVLAGPTSEWYGAWRRTWVTGPLRVIDLPAIPEATKIAVLAASDVLVQPSLYEAFGIVFLEAWASGVPVIGANFGAVPEVVGDGGLVFEPANPIDLATKLEWLLTHPDEARAMAARGRARAIREHTWDRAGAAVEEAYAIALAQRRPRPGTVPGSDPGPIKSGTATPAERALG